MTNKVLLFGGTGGIGSAIKVLLEERGFEVNATKRKIELWTPYGEEKFGYVINAAGIISPSPIYAASPNYEMIINAFAPLRLMRMLGTDPVYINIGSTAASTCRGGWVGYNASKAALEAITRTAAHEGYKTILVSPGGTKTRMRTKLFGDEGSKVLIEPKDIAKLVLSVMPQNHPSYRWGDVIYLKPNEGQYSSFVEELKT